MAQVKKKLNFNVGRLVRLKNENVTYKVIDVRYIIFSGGEDWQYSLRSDESNNVRIVVGDKNLVAVKTKGKEK